MSKEMVISANPHETRVAILEEGQLCEYYVEREKEFALVGSIYKGRVTRVLPGMQSAFVDIGLDSDAFLYVTDFLEDVEELDHVVTTVEEKVQKMEDQGGQVFPAAASTAPSAEPSDVQFGHIGPEASHDSPPADFAPPSEGSFHQAPPSAPVSAPPPVSRPPYVDRGHSQQNRPRDGGRDFRGRGGRRGGRSGGQRGGQGGRGGGRFSRELPPSKYASHRPYDAGPAAGSVDPNAPEGHVNVILPGESLAKFREKTVPPPIVLGEENLTPQAAAPDRMTVQDHEQAQRHYHETVQEHENAPIHDPVHEPSHEAIHDAAPEAAAPVAPAARPPAREFRPASRFESRSDSHSDSRSFASGLEPLPGETLSKYSRRETPAMEHHEPATLPAMHEEHIASAGQPVHEDIHEAVSHHEEPAPDHSHDAFGAHEAHESDSAHETHAQAESHEEHAHPELTEDEAATIAEHVAEAQIDEAARDAQVRSFASDEDSHAAGLTAAEQSAAESETEDEEELEEEEAEAETEGMLAPATEGEHQEAEHADHEHTHVDDLAAASESGSSESGMPPTGDYPPAASQPPSQARVRDDFRPRMQHPSRRGGRDRGRRDDRGRRPQHGHRPQQSHGGHHRTAPRRPMLIADMLKQGQEIIVQIAKEPLGKKGARITSHVALPGRSLVYMPTLDHTGVSRKIASAEERSRLRHLVNDAKGAAGGGFIVRTAAGAAAPEEVRADVEFLTHTWAEIKSRSEQRKAPSILHRDLNLVERILRDFITPDFAAIWVDTEEEYTKVVEFMSRFQPQLVGRVKLYTKETPVFEEFGIQQEIDKGLRPKVWLKSGGYIVINHTEALVAIDVNTGKFVGKGSNRLEDTIVRTNLEATKEIVRQMRLRDLGGIIVIDFIDMEDRRNREKVMAALEDALRADRAPSKMLRFNEFGLIAITRKRTKQALERTLCQPCPYCTGSGMVKSIPTLCYEIQTEARKMAPDMDSGSLTLRVHPEIAKALKTRESSLIEELERWTKKSMIIQADPTLHWEQYDIY
jgi:Rne/Rng family ribonuclease